VVIVRLAWPPVKLAGAVSWNTVPQPLGAARTSAAESGRAIEIARRIGEQVGDGTPPSLPPVKL
jgi:hypothetical protein